MALQLDIKEILDFSWCPQYYDIKNQNPHNKTLNQQYDESLRKVFYSYIRSIQDGSLKDNIKFLKYRWGKEWIKKKTNSEIICTPYSPKDANTHESKRKAGIDAILTFEEMMNDSQFPIIINKPYRIKIINGLYITGVWEYVREVKYDKNTRVFQLIKFRTENNAFNTEHQMGHDLELTASAFAFKEFFNVEDFELLYFDLPKKRIIRASRKETDYALLKNTAKSVAICLKNDIRCICPDKRCVYCEYRSICEQYIA